METEITTKLFSIVDSYTNEDAYVRVHDDTINIYTANLIIVASLKLKKTIVGLNGWYKFQKGKCMTKYEMPFRNRRIFIDGFIPVYEIDFP